jgi:hypothetical protein
MKYLFVFALQRFIYVRVTGQCFGEATSVEPEGARDASPAFRRVSLIFNLLHTNTFSIEL